MVILFSINILFSLPSCTTRSYGSHASGKGYRIKKHDDHFRHYKRSYNKPGTWGLDRNKQYPD